MRARGFTLIEVLAVVALLGLLAGATAWAVAEDVQRSSRAKVIGQIAYADHMARLAAERLGQPCMLRFDLQRQGVWRVIGAEEDRQETSPVLKFPAAYRLDRVIIFETAAAPGSARRQRGGGILDSGVADIVYSTGGRSAGYALRLVSGEEEKGRGPAEIGMDREKWLVFSGLTGQLALDLDEDKVNNLLASLAGGARPDAH